MAEHKTAALLECCCALGALFGGAEREQAKLLGAFGRDVGLAFQYVDDLLGIWGDPASTGKPVFSDLRNRKKSLPVVAALRSDTTDGRELKLLYRRPTALEPAELTRAAALIEAAGARKWCEDRINALLARALGNLSAARPTPIAEAELDSLARLMTRRDR